MKYVLTWTFALVIAYVVITGVFASGEMLSLFSR